MRSSRRPFIDDPASKSACRGVLGQSDRCNRRFPNIRFETPPCGRFGQDA